jgi:hypothetical protein
VIDFGDLSVFSANHEITGDGRSFDGASVEINDIIDLNVLLDQQK